MVLDYARPTSCGTESSVTKAEVRRQDALVGRYQDDHGRIPKWTAIWRDGTECANHGTVRWIEAPSRSIGQGRKEVPTA